MSFFEYKVVPAPRRGQKARGVRTPEARFAYALEDLMNKLGAEGWQYQRTDTLPVEQRDGLTGKTTVYQNMLVFRRALKEHVMIDVPEGLKDPAPAQIEAPKPKPRKRARAPRPVITQPIPTPAPAPGLVELAESLRKPAAVATNSPSAPEAPKPTRETDVEAEAPAVAPVLKVVGGETSPHHSNAQSAPSTPKLHLSPALRARAAQLNRTTAAE